jgi:hypothetical protein
MVHGGDGHPVRHPEAQELVGVAVAVGDGPGLERQDGRVVEDAHTAA